MQSNEKLRGDMIVQIADMHLSQYLNQPVGQTVTLPNRRIHEDVGNGESITGFNYLHGSNPTVGDFSLAGTATVVSKTGSACTIKADIAYQWNDIISPKAQYGTDMKKARLGNVLSFGQAKNYIIRIWWRETVTVTFVNGGAVSESGWPFDPKFYGHQGNPPPDPDYGYDMLY